MVSSHIYADDTQQYICIRPASLRALSDDVSKVQTCVKYVEHWMTTNMLKLNTDKTDGWMNQAYSRLSTTHGHITDCKLLVSMYWTRLVLVRPVFIRQDWSIADWISGSTQKGQAGYYPDWHHTHPYPLWTSAQSRSDVWQKPVNGCTSTYLQKICTLLTEGAASKLVTFLVLSRLDYCNAFLHNILSRMHNHVQRVIHAAARIVKCIRKYDHITLDLIQLHWLHVTQWIQ